MYFQLLGTLVVIWLHNDRIEKYIHTHWKIVILFVAKVWHVKIVKKQTVKDDTTQGVKRLNNAAMRQERLYISSKLIFNTRLLIYSVSKVLAYHMLPYVLIRTKIWILFYSYLKIIYFIYLWKFFIIIIVWWLNGVSWKYHLISWVATLSLWEITE